MGRNKKDRNRKPREPGFNENPIPNMANAARASAEILWEAFRRCDSFQLHPGGGMSYPYAPAMVLAAFSIETGFKALLLREGKRREGHPLLPLFHALSPEVKALIFAETALEGSRFEAGLVRMNRGFEEWRYLYEKRSHSIDMHYPRVLGSAVQAVFPKVEWPADLPVS